MLSSSCCWTGRSEKRSAFSGWRHLCFQNWEGIWRSFTLLYCVCVFLQKESITGKNWFSLTDHCWWLREEGRHYVSNGHSISWGNNCYWNILLRWTLWSHFCSPVGPWILSILSLKDIKLFFPDFLNPNKVVSFFPLKAYFQGLYDLSVFDC